VQVEGALVEWGTEPAKEGRTSRERSTGVECEEAEIVVQSVD